MRVGDLVNHNPKYFTEPWVGGIIIETKDDPMNPILTQHKVYWPGESPRWIEEGFLEKTNESG
tara:strand:+ start:414 stop:602 length:189 start_codon:yes stop_codon:yes gene_type:complete